MAISAADPPGAVHSPVEGSLGISAAPFDDESLPGFVMRVARSLRFRSADRLAAITGLRQPGSAVSGTNLGRLAERTGSRPCDLERIAYRPAERFAHHAFLGGAVHRELIDIGRRRLCPRCIEEVPYHRASWDLALLTACPEHGVRLVDVCPNPGCGRRIDWRRPNLGRCACGLDFTSLVGETVPAAEAKACGHLIDLVRGANLPWLPEALAACDRSDLARLTMCLGMFATGWVGERRIETLVNSGADSVAAVIMAGMTALADWPVTLHGLLRAARVSEGGRHGRYGARKALGAIYSWLTMMEAGAVKSALAAAARDYVDLDPELSRRVHRSRLLSRPGAGGSVIGLNEAAAILGVSGNGVKASMASGTLPEVPSEGRGVPMSLPRGAVDELARQTASNLTLKDAAALLGISKSRMRRLVAAGVVAVQRPAEKRDGSPWALHRPDVLTLLGRVMARCGARVAPECQVTFEHAAEVLRRSGVDFARFVKMIVEEEVRVVGVDAAGRGLKRLRFDRAELRAVCGATDGRTVVSVQEAARRLGMKWQVARHLVDIGILAAVEGRISIIEIERFRGEFISGSVLAKQRKTSPGHLALLFERGAAILPVTGPNVDGGRQNFFRRSDIAKSFGIQATKPR